MANDRAPLQEIIRRKRDGRHLTRREIQRFIDAVSTGAASEGQIGAFAMAVLLNGMGVEECADLTLSMRDSGEVIDWSHLGLPGPVVDKHSTGGVGDTVSLMLAPMLAACGTFVPMISGRGLGHTGGTLDKLAAIPGYNTKPDIKRFQEVVVSAGCAIIGQTASLAPADGRIYSVRDVTATVESIPLITASILSKKLAAGLDALVMDIKLGNGAFMTDLDQAIGLAQSIGQVSKEAGLKVCSLITDMNEPLASAAGNVLEIRETIDYLSGRFRDPRLHEVVIQLCALLLVQSGAFETKEPAAARLQEALDSGEAQRRFDAMVEQLGGPRDFCDNAEQYLESAPAIAEVHAGHEGYIAQVDTRSLGLAVVALGGGRARPDDSIDLRVGLDRIARIGTKVSKGDLMCRIHARSQQEMEHIQESLLKAFAIAPDRPEAAPLIIQEMN